MSWNGAGIFNRIYLWASDALNALSISSSRMDTEFDNYKTGLENCVTRDGQNQASANLPMGTFRHTAVGTASARDHYAQVGQIQDTGYIWGNIAGGTANALTIAVIPAITAYATGQTFRLVTLLANTAAVTLAVNGLATKAIVKENGAALVSGDLAINTAIEVVYNGTNFRLMRPGVLLSGAALTDVLHTTGNESKAGVLTLTTAFPVVMSSASPVIEGRYTPTGVTAHWRLYMPFTDNNVYLLRNTHASGDFSTTVNVLTINGTTGDATLTGKITAANGPLAGGYGGRITNAGTAAVAYGPSGWSVVRDAVGVTTVTHNLGTTSYAPVLVASAGVARPSAITTTTFTVTTTNLSGTNLDMDYNFVVARN